jgi:hypothetical protein
VRCAMRCPGGSTAVCQPYWDGRVESDPCRSRIRKQVARPPPRSPEIPSWRAEQAGRQRYLASAHLQPWNGGSSERLMVANNSHIGSAQMSRPRSAPEAGRMGSPF